MVIELRSLGKLIAECWIKAERATAKLIDEKYHSPNEENITFLFSAELRTSVREASDSARVTNAFLADLRQAVHHLTSADLREYSDLIARVNFHNRQHEGRESASDLGIVVKRPQLRLESSRIRLNFEFATGMLAQAKLGRSSNSIQGKYTWGQLTAAQRRLFRKRRDYYSLLLYRLSGTNSNQLTDFGWQLCKGYTVRKVQEWLGSGAFPEELCSAELMRQLFADRIGTRNPTTIETIIDPDAPPSQTIELQVFWPKDRTPPPSYHLKSPIQGSQRLSLHQQI